jgi:16S rRNA processing protein RimM
LRVGRLTKAHGLKGAIKVEVYTDDPGRGFVPGAGFTLQVPTSSPWHGKTLELIELKWFNSHAVAFFNDVPDRSAAEKLIKAILWVDQDLDEPTDEEDAWFDHQLVGLSVLRDGVKVGVVSLVDHLPAQDLLHVTTDAGEVLVPFVKAIVPSVAIAAGTLTVTPPVGLFEELPDEQDDEPDDEPEPQPALEAETAPTPGTDPIRGTDPTPEGDPIPEGAPTPETNSPS